MAVYRCVVCGYIFDEEKEGKSFDELEVCPVCKQGKSKFELVETETAESKSEKLKATKQENKEADLSENEYPEYDKTYMRIDKKCRYMSEIHEMAVSGKSISAAMGTQMPMPGWDDILLMGAQLDPMPLNDEDEVDTMVVIGKNAKKPLIIENPIYISHMSFGALSKETKVALAAGSKLGKSAMCSGEGGMLPEEFDAAAKYIFEYIPNKYSVTDENLRKVDAIEIKIGQGTKPGMGGHLPGDKVTPEIAAMRDKKVGEDIKSPSKFPGVNTKDDLKALVSELRARSDGRPIGIKLAAGRIEKDMAFAAYAEPDFITIDGRGGATASSPFFLREATSVPTVFALHRARKFLDSINSDISLIITGGLRVSADFAKAIAMGADAVAVASSALIAAACQQYRICDSGNCPVGIATQDPKLRARLNGEAAAKRVGNFLNVSLEELKSFARITGHKRLSDLNTGDLCTTSLEISTHTDIEHV
ncbi:MAG: glutamate synthase-related protein [Eubacterium sp.]|nr:glutamate synthase-related protein [Eubacterium sp.]